MKLVLAFSISALSFASAYAASIATPPSDEPSVVGFWQESDDEGHVGAWFYFTKVKGHYEGRFVKMFKQKPDDPTFEVCSNCTGDQKDAPMIGLTLIKGMHRDGLKYEDGTILDPRDGTLYNALMELSPDGQKLSVRGYLGIPLLGQTQVWDRLPDDTMSPCDIPEESFGPTALRPKASASPTPPHPTGCDTTASVNLKDAATPTPTRTSANVKDSAAPTVTHTPGSAKDAATPSPGRTSASAKDTATPTRSPHAKDSPSPSASHAKDHPKPSPTHSKDSAAASPTASPED